MNPMAVVSSSSNVEFFSLNSSERFPVDYRWMKGIYQAGVMHVPDKGTRCLTKSEPYNILLLAL
jgi:hypothetical protein